MLEFVKGIKVYDEDMELITVVYENDKAKVVDQAGEVFEGVIVKLAKKEMQLMVEGESSKRLFALDTVTLQFDEEDLV